MDLARREDEATGYLKDTRKKRKSKWQKNNINR